MSRDVVDVLIVGSGASAVHAAIPLVEAGLRVRMLDFGNVDEHYAPLIPDAPFAAIRSTDPDQHRYLLGDRFEGIGFEPTGAGAQLTPPRRHVVRDTHRLTPVQSDDFFPLESLARGGLAEAWGAGCPTFADADLRGTPLSRALLDPHYEAVARRIGISGEPDDLRAFFGEAPWLQPGLKVDTNAQTILRRYDSQRARLARAGLHLGIARLAALSRELGERRPVQYHDMEFFSDRGRSVYRPRYTLEELRAIDSFDYRPRVLVGEFRETETGVEVCGRHTDGTPVRHRGDHLVLAAGTLGTARIVLRSLGEPKRTLPLVCNPHTYAATLNLAMLGRRADEARHSLAQLCFVHAPEGPQGDTTVGHLYSYRSLQLFRLARDLPLPFRESLRVLPSIVSALTILILQHADRPTALKSCRLVAGGLDGTDRLRIDYSLSAEEQRRIDRCERAILRAFRRLRCLPLRRVRPGHAASVHYAGTLPMTRDDRPWTTGVDGRLAGTRAVRVADGSVFPALPSRGLTFTMMANARRIGCALRDEIAGGAR